MSDVPTTIIDNSDDGKLFEGKTPEELEALLDAFTSGEPMPAPEPEPAPPEPQPEPTPEPPPQAEPPPAEEPEPDLTASEIEGERIRRERLEAQLAQQQAHGSRLAGEIGHLRKLLESRPAPSEPYEPQTEREESRIQQLERIVAETQSRQVQSEVAQVVKEAFMQLDATNGVADLGAEIQELAPKYQEQFKSLLAMTDTELARQSAAAIGRIILAEARESRWEKNHRQLVERKASTAAKAVEAKKASTVTGSGGVPPPAPQPKTLADLTVEEADQWLRENTL